MQIDNFHDHTHSPSSIICNNNSLFLPPPTFSIIILSASSLPRPASAVTSPLSPFHFIPSIFILSFSLSALSASYLPLLPSTSFPRYSLHPFWIIPSTPYSALVPMTSSLPPRYPIHTSLHFYSLPLSLRSSSFPKQYHFRFISSFFIPFASSLLLTVIPSTHPFRFIPSGSAPLPLHPFLFLSSALYHFSALSFPLPTFRFNPSIFILSISTLPHHLLCPFRFRLPPFRFLLL